MSKAPLCIECNTPAELVDGRAIYPHRPDLYAKSFWRCPRCHSSYTGCHDGTKVAKGRPAGKFTRDKRILAHSFFDRLWKARIKRDGVAWAVARNEAYRWLADELGIHQSECHIGEMDAKMAMRVVEICGAESVPNWNAGTST